MRIYHFLCRAFGQSVAVAQVVDLDVANIVSVLSIDFCIEGGGPSGRGFSTRRALSLRGRLVVSGW